MAGEQIRLGPFVDGLNTFSDPTAITDTSLAEVVNFELDLDGSLVNRPPIAMHNNGIVFTGSTAKVTKLLGWYVDSAGSYRLIATDTIGVTSWFDGANWNQITQRAVTAVVQYRDDLWLIVDPDAAYNGGKWNPSTGFVEDVNIPKGQAIIQHKDRLWVAPGKKATSNGTRLYMSVIVSAAVSWPVSKVFINIGAGDGQNIVDIVVYNQDVLIFKTNSTYRFSFSSDPAIGTVTKISATIGASDTGCFAEYENMLYILFKNVVYMFANYNFEKLNSNVPLDTDNPSTNLISSSSISVWADRVIVQYYSSTYVYSIKTRTWSIWRSKNPDLQFMGKFWTDPMARDDLPSAYLASTERNKTKVFRVVDAITSASEEMECTFRTKNYDYQSAANAKRLFRWGIDVIANIALTAETLPVIATKEVTWGELETYNWEDLLTWGSPLEVTPNKVEVIPVQGNAFGRKYVQVKNQGGRFRQIAFRVTGTTNGDTATAPLRIFNIATIVKDAAKVSKQIS